MKTIKEILNTGVGTEGSVIIAKKIHDVLLPEAEKFLLPRTLAALYIGPAQIPGSSYDINLESPNSLDVRVIGEGAEIWLDDPLYTSTNIKPKKYGVGIKITTELKEDSKFPLLERAGMLAGQRLAENENALIITALDGAANTTAGGAAITIANITESMFDLENSDYNPTDFIVGTEVLSDLRNIDTFVEANKIGNRDILSTGFIGNIFGMNVHKVSTNAGMTRTSSYILDKNHAFAIVEKRPITIEGFDIKTHDMSGIVATQRIAIGLLRSSAVSKITTS